MAGQPDDESSLRPPRHLAAKAFIGGLATIDILATVLTLLAV